MQAVEQETVRFYTTSQNLKLVRVGQEPAINTAGQIVGVKQPEVSFDFSPNGEVFATSGVGVLLDEDGVERDEVEWLRAHPYHGVRFVEDGREPGRLLPTEEEFGAEVVEATADLDSQRLRGLYDEERSTHNRPGLIALVEGALRKVEGLEVDPAAGDGS